MYGCRDEAVTTDVCQLGTKACMVSQNPSTTKRVEGFGNPNRMLDGVAITFQSQQQQQSQQTCRLCCFGSKCHNPAPASETRVSVMKDLLSKTGLESEVVENYVELENEIAFNRGVVRLTTKAPPTEAEYEEEEFTTEEEDATSLSEDRLPRTTFQSPTEEIGEDAFSSETEDDPTLSDNEYNASKFSTYNVDESSDPVEESEESPIVKENYSLDSTKENVHEKTADKVRIEKAEYLPIFAEDNEKVGRPSKERMKDEDSGETLVAVNFKRLGNSAIREASRISAPFVAIFLLLVRI
ncbi:unnamed protein product [Rodentolepis nana]|uniref:LEM domain-containing protein n=1 Tax=Rodentolepis nana TaxID=102285 RepID=A0A158QHE7_RODNA|nr:unnamed protein product [Rodentolepis nana]